MCGELLWVLNEERDSKIDSQNSQGSKLFPLASRLRATSHGSLKEYVTGLQCELLGKEYSSIMDIFNICGGGGIHACVYVLLA